MLWVVRYLGKILFRLNSSYFLVFVLAFMGTIACSEPQGAELQKDVFNQEVLKFLTDKNVEAFFDQQAVGSQPQDPALDCKSAIHRQFIARMNFYHDYVSVYYPRALIISNYFFAQIGIAELEKALLIVVDMLASEPWFYVANSPVSVNVTHYWEFIVDQLALISNFLCRACIDEKTEQITIPEEDDLWLWDWPSDDEEPGKVKQKQLINYLIEQKITAVYDFYALSFDYVVKLFNEGILIQSVEQAVRYATDLEWVVQRLQGSYYEAAYQEHLKTVSELLEILKNRKSDSLITGAS